MYNPFDLIPHTIDKDIRGIIITLIVIQVSAFLIFFFYLIWAFIRIKLGYIKIEKVDENKNDESLKKEENSSENQEESKKIN